MAPVTRANPVAKPDSSTDLMNTSVTILPTDTPGAKSVRFQGSLNLPAGKLPTGLSLKAASPSVQAPSVSRTGSAHHARRFRLEDLRSVISHLYSPMCVVLSVVVFSKSGLSSGHGPPVGGELSQRGNPEGCEGGKGVYG